MKLKYEFIVEKIEDTYTAVPVGPGSDDFHGIVNLNETGAFIFNCLSKETSYEKIVTALKSEYPSVSTTQISNDLDCYLEALRKNKLLEE